MGNQNMSRRFFYQKKKALLLCTSALILSLLSGCGEWEARLQAELSQEMDPYLRAESLPQPEETEEIADAFREEPSPETAESASSQTEQTELSAGELADFEIWLNDVENNGFLCSAYEDVRQADLNAVFYNGAGLAQQPLTEELRRAYEAQAGEISTDTVRLTTAQIDGFLRKKTGFGLEEFAAPPDWTWLPDQDVWMTQHGDTNRMTVVCDSGVRTRSGLTELSCHVPDGTSALTLTVTLKETPDGRLFVKNRITGGFPAQQADVPDANASFQDAASPTLPFDPAQIADFSTGADISAAAGFQSWGDFSLITEENLYGTWYCPSDADETEAVLILSPEGAYVYFPLLDCFGDQLYTWEVEDRSASGLCPALKIYISGPDSGPLAWYIAGLTPEYFWCNSQQDIFYRQDTAG